MTARAKGSRLMREGWVPANPPRVRKSAMAIPKTNRAGAPYGVIPTAQIGRAITEVTPYVKYALGLIVDSADLLETDAGQTFLVVPAEPELMDALATVGAEHEDLEDGGDYERTDPAADGSLYYGYGVYPYVEPTDVADNEPDADDEPRLNYMP